VQDSAAARGAPLTGPQAGPIRREVARQEQRGGHHDRKVGEKQGAPSDGDQQAPPSIGPSAAVSGSGAAVTSVMGAGGLCLGTGLLATVNAQTSIVAPVAAMVPLGASNAFNNLALKAELTDTASPRGSEPRQGSFKPRGSSGPR
jgi:hypothetical protein